MKSIGGWETANLGKEEKDSSGRRKVGNRRATFFRRTPSFTKTVGKMTRTGSPSDAYSELWTKNCSEVPLSLI
ncbi:hypothetical protein CEXT_87921 [Caerostris extrusa]|uniref:Ycf15 n=1 Tax=Caerostris extrusa TaxID=172846 RepID=A0AAV4XQ21_CAEEX|nr:hypothetical protein CEXT_87921 [Caerostris extrusa]